MFQVLAQALVVLLTFTSIKLPSVTGIEAVFAKDHSNSLVTTAFFYGSIIWSLLGINNSLFSYYYHSKENNVPDLGKLLMYVSLMITTFLRLTIIILYLCPILGLFDILLPYQIQDSIPNSWHVEENKDLNWFLLLTPRQTLILLLCYPAIHALIVVIYKCR